MDLGNFGCHFGAPWPSLLPTATPPLDNVGTSTDQTDPYSLPNELLVLPTTTGALDASQTAPTTEPIPSHHSSHTSSFDTSDSSTDLAIRLIKPQPTQGGAVIVPRLETHVFLDIDLPSGSWNAILLPLTKSVTTDDSASIAAYIKPLLLVILVRGATTGQECSCVCEQCEKRMGNKIGSPSLIDFHSPSNIIAPRGGTIQVHFTFSCYSRHHQKQDQQFLLEVILKDASNSLEPVEVARKELPYSFDVRSSIPRAKESTSGYMQQANISSSSDIRRRAKRPGPAVTPSPPSSTQLHLGSGISTSRPSAVPMSPLLVQPRHGPSDGEVRDSLEDSQGPESANRLEGSTLYTNAPHIAHGIIAMNHDMVRKQAPPVFAPTFNSFFEASHVPPNTEVQMRGKVADREVQIDALEKIIKRLRDTFEADGREKDAALQPLIGYLYGQIISIQKEIADRLNAFSAERQQAGAAVSAEVANLEAQIHILKQENYHDASVLTAMADTCSWIG